MPVQEIGGFAGTKRETEYSSPILMVITPITAQLSPEGWQSVAVVAHGDEQDEPKYGCEGITFLKL
jgi:hypothetical protein